jgi:outer membrane protein
MVFQLRRLVVVFAGCSAISCLLAQDKQLGVSPVISTFDQIIGMSQCDMGKEEQAVMEQLQAKYSEQLEGDRKKLDDRLKVFNAKKDTLSEDARKKEEQELMAASNNLQNEVRKAQELIRAEMGKATERLSKLTEEAAVEIAKAEKVDVLLEKNTGRVVYTKNGTDLTDKIQNKMNEKTTLAKNSKGAAKAPVKTAAAEQKKLEKVA